MRVAVTVDLPLTNICEFADNERNFHTSLSDSWQNGNLRIFTLYITASADTNTAFFAAFGENSVITNSILESSEHLVSFGWSAGKWKILPAGLREHCIAAPASTNAGEKTLFERMRVSAENEEVSEIEFREGGPEGRETPARSHCLRIEYSLFLSTQFPLKTVVRLCGESAVSIYSKSDQSDITAEEIVNIINQFKQQN